MSTIHRYIARQYLLNVITLFVVLFGFVVTVDVFVNLRRFISAAQAAQDLDGDQSTLHQTVLTVTLIVDLWVPRLLQLFNVLTGVVLVAGMGFTCMQLVRNRELIALLASGVSLFRLARPFFAVALLVTVVQAANQELLVPSVAHLLTRDIGESGNRSIEGFRVVLTPDGEDRFFSARTYDDTTKLLTGVTIFVRDADGRLLETIWAGAAQWDGAGWVFSEDAIVRPERIDATAEPPAPRPIERLDSPLEPERIILHHRTGFAQNLSWTQLGAMIDSGGLRPEHARQLDRLRWGRVAVLVSNLMTLVAALPFFLVRMPQPMLLPALKAAPVALAGLGAAAATTVVPLGGLPAWIGAFVPGLVLAPIAIALFTGIRS